MSHGTPPSSLSYNRLPPPPHPLPPLRSAPDTCTCAPGWGGFDCRTPVCTVFLTPALRAQVATRDPALYGALEQDPCGGGGKGNGACTRPGVCTCACRRRAARDANGRVVGGPYSSWTLAPLAAGVVFGSSDCTDGYEGARHADGTFATCHLRIYTPTYLELHLVEFVLYALAGVSGGTLVLLALREYLRRRALRLRLGRRRRAGGATGTGTGTGTGTDDGTATSAGGGGGGDGAEDTEGSQEGVGEGEGGGGGATGGATGAGAEGKGGASAPAKAGGWGGLLGAGKKKRS